MGGARAPASFRWTGKRSLIIGANKSSPAVAKTERAKPASRACQGSPITTAAMAKPSAGNESAARLLACAKIKTAAIAAARSTDGDGRTSATKQISAIAVASRRYLLFLIGNCINHKTNEETIAKLAPLTATK
ncbi:unannotated protein [freshwater metagenome]|uniref:Unannotated protein n=1 Tax=freshwater metagenome TaxID=449393 RepID=A0A6J6EL64_9ZZZZ